MKTTINKAEKRTFGFHIAYSVLDGLIYGILALNEFVLLKSLKGTDYQIGFLVQIPIIVLLFSIVFNELIKRTRHKKRFLKVFATLTRLPLLLVLLFPSSPEGIGMLHQYVFLFVLLVYFFSTPIILPTINLFLKQSYSHENFGKYYSYATSISKIVALFSTFFAGYLLDLNHFFFKQLFVVLAISSIASVFILTRIDYEDRIPVIRKTLFQSLATSLRQMKTILQTNKPFLFFEIGFMLYGIAYIATAGVISLFLNDALNLNYSSLAFYKNGYNTVNILLLPLFGRLIGKIDPRKFGIITFGSLGLFFVFLFVGTIYNGYFEIWKIKVYYALIVAYIFYGIFSATMGLLWFIGSAYFSKNEEAGDYQSIHLSLTGARGVFAPLAGIYFYFLIDYGGVFLMGAAFILLSIFTMIFSLRRHGAIRN